MTQGPLDRADWVYLAHRSQGSKEDTTSSLVAESVFSPPTPATLCLSGMAPTWQSCSPLKGGIRYFILEEEWMLKRMKLRRHLSRTLQSNNCEAFFQMGSQVPTLSKKLSAINPRFSPMESPGILTTLQGRPHTQQEIDRTEQTQWNS